MIERWETIAHYPEYLVSSEGRIKRLARKQTMPINNKEVLFKEHILKTHIIYQTEYYGRESVVLCKDGKPRTHSVARLVAEAFVKNHSNKPEVHHIDHNPLNNSVKNLMWVTREEQRDTHMAKAQQEHSKGRVAHNRLKIIYDGKEYDTYTELAKSIGCSQSAISQAKTRGQTTLKGKPIVFNLS